MDFLKKKRDFVDLIIKHIGTSAIMDLLLRLLTCIEPPQPRQDVLNVSRIVPPARGRGGGGEGEVGTGATGSREGSWEVGKGRLSGKQGGLGRKEGVGCSQEEIQVLQDWFFQLCPFVGAWGAL